MRPLKFRAWDKRKNIMYKVNWIAELGDVLTSHNIGLMHSIEFPSDLMPLEERFDNKKHFELMQFTGLLDKNGKEIYENDIVKSESHTNPSSFQIEFIEGGFCATNPIIKGYPLDINHFYPSVGCCIEVIGNIYENSELLNEVK